MRAVWRWVWVATLGVAGFGLVPHLAPGQWAVGVGAGLARAADAATLPDSEVGLYLAAAEAEREADYPAASALLGRLLDAHADDIRLRRRAFLAALAAGEAERTVAHAAALRQAGDTALPIAPMAEAIAALADGRADEARDLLDGVDAVGLERFALPFVQAWTRMADGDVPGAMVALEQAGLPSGTEGLLLEQAAHILLLADDPTGAETKLLAMAATPDALPVSSKRLLARVWTEQGRAGEARDLLSRASDGAQGESLLLAADIAALTAGRTLPPMLSDPAQGLALALQTIGRFAQRQSQLMALRYHRLALMLDPAQDLAWLGVGGILQDRQQYVQSNLALEEVSATSPFRIEARMEVIANLQASGDGPAAILAARALADEAPRRYEPLMQLGTIHRMGEDWEAAIEAYDEAIARVPTPEREHWRLFYFRGIAHERAKHWDAAEADFQQALALEPEQPFVLNYLGYSWVEQGRNLAEAKAMIKRAVAREYDNGAIVDSLGWVLYRIGEYEEAVGELERAVQLEPQDPVINDHLGDAYWMVGRKVEAQFQWKRVLNLEPEPDLEAVVLRKLADGMEPPEVLTLE